MTQPDGRFAEHARAWFEAALSGLADDASDVEVLGPAERGLMALHMHYGSTKTITLDPVNVLDDIDRPEPTCVCPPDLVARGGYRGNCPAHNPT